MYSVQCYEENTSWDGDTTRQHFIKTIYSSMQNRVVGNLERSVVCNEGDPEGSILFLGHLQVLSDKIATTLHSSALVLYPVHVLLMKC